MNQMKKGYIKPVLYSEAFVPSSYVAACVAEIGETQYYLACDSDLNGTDGHKHRENGCKDAGAYTVNINKEKHITQIIENSSWTNQSCSNIKVMKDGVYVNADQVEIELNGTYYLQWETDAWGAHMTHFGDFRRITPINVNMS